MLYLFLNEKQSFFYSKSDPTNLKAKPMPPIAPIASNTNLRWVK
jgi:hypothetical protein